MKEFKKTKLGSRGDSFVLEDENGVWYKECNKCGEIKELNSQNFYKQNTTKSGFRSICKICGDEYQMDRYRNEEGFKQKTNIIARNARRKNPEHYRRKQREYYKKQIEENPEEVRKESRKSVKNYKSKTPAGIYKITCTHNGRVYIGESKSVNMRWTSHKSALKCDKGKTNKLLQEDWDNFGEEGFKFEILEILPKDKDILRQKEMEYLKKEMENGTEIYNKSYTSKEKKTRSFGCVYTIKCKANSRIYVGRTENWKSRKQSHLVSFKKNQHHNLQIQNDWNEFGEENFEFSIIERDNSIEALTRKERSLINEFINDRIKLYNIGELTIEQLQLINENETMEAK